MSQYLVHPQRIQRVWSSYVFFFQACWELSLFYCTPILLVHLNFKPIHARQTSTKNLLQKVDFLDPANRPGCHRKDTSSSEQKGGSLGNSLHVIFEVAVQAAASFQNNKLQFFIIRMTSCSTPASDPNSSKLHPTPPGHPARTPSGCAQRNPTRRVKATAHLSASNNARPDESCLLAAKSWLSWLLGWQLAS